MYSRTVCFVYMYIVYYCTVFYYNELYIYCTVLLNCTLHNALYFTDLYFDTVIGWSDFEDKMNARQGIGIARHMKVLMLP